MPVTAVQAWLLGSGPALRWQVERDVVGAPPEVWEGTRRRVATEGLGARLLALQDDDGQWAGGAYFPSDATREEPRQPWTATTWSLNALREWGLDPAVLRSRGTVEKLARTRWDYDDLPFWEGEVDVCSNGYTLANGVWLGADVDPLVAAALHDGVAPDPRLGEAVEMVRAARQPDGTWLQGDPHEGRVWFDVDAPTGQPSKWLTFHASRVLAWWEHAAGEDAGSRSAAASPAGGR